MAGSPNSPSKMAAGSCSGRRTVLPPYRRTWPGVFPSGASPGGRRLLRLRVLGQKPGDVARHLGLHSRPLRRSFARLLGTGTARSAVEIDGGLIPKRGIGQDAADRSEERRVGKE